MAVVMPSLGGPTAACWRTLPCNGTGLYRLGRGGREAWLTCRPANAAAWTNAGCPPRPSVPEPAAKPRPLLDLHLESPPPDCRKQRQSPRPGGRHGQLATEPPERTLLGAPRPPEPGVHSSGRPYPWSAPKFSRAKPSRHPAKQRASRLRAASSAWPGAIKAHEAVAYVAQEHSGESTGCARRIEVLEACLDRAQPKP